MQIYLILQNNAIEPCLSPHSIHIAGVADKKRKYFTYYKKYLTTILLAKSCSKNHLLFMLDQLI